MSNKSFVELLLFQPLPSDEVRKQICQLIDREIEESKLPGRLHRFDIVYVAIMAYSLGKIHGIRQERQRKKKKPCK